MTTTAPTSFASPSRPPGIGWSWPRLFRHLGIGPSAASMLTLPYLHRLPPAPTPSAESGSGAGS